MTWTSYTIEHKGKSMEGWVDLGNLQFEVPYELNIKANDTFDVNGQKVIAKVVNNIGGRNETLQIQGELQDGKSQKGGTATKSGEAKAESKTDD
tara:strand:+ start:1310 stop:1591 length:282 start_codon:yes stop_codon:yes gene_type:complete